MTDQFAGERPTYWEFAGVTCFKVHVFFDLTREQVTAVLDFAARSLETPAPAKCSFSLTTALLPLSAPSSETIQSKRRKTLVGRR